jgi:PAS domain S-box-containing protein
MIEALQERSRARDWLDALIQSIVEGVVTIDGAGNITFLSQGAERLLGWPPAEAVGRSIDALLPPLEGDGETFRAQMPPMGAKRQIAVRTRLGKEIILAVTGAELIPPGAETPQVALVLRDVTSEEALRHLRSYFLANISHEFRTPLSTLNASMELLLDPAAGLSAGEMRQLLKPGYLSVRALQTLIDNLLESSSIEAGRFTIQRRPTDLDEVLSAALHMVGPLLERRQQEVSVTRQVALLPLVADASRLTQVLVNLLVNASKYSPPGQPIAVRVERRENHLYVAVADRGPGIPPADRTEIFRRFVRRDPTDGEQYGIGLGLYVVKTIVEAHGGTVGVADRSAGGSIFWFTLPLDEAGESS